jgi:hypothetical protein
MFRVTDEASQVPTFRVKNTAGEDAPSWAVMKVTGFDTDSGCITVSKPDSDSLALLMFNGPAGIPAGNFGAATFFTPTRVLYDTGDGTPGVASPPEAWGTGSGSWKLRKGKRGVFALGGADNGSAVFLRATLVYGVFDPVTCEFTGTYGSA